MPTFLKYKNIFFFHLDLRSDPDPGFFLLSRNLIHGKNPW